MSEKWVSVVDLYEGDEGWPPKGLFQFKDWITGVAAQVPTEHWDAAEIELASRGDGMNIRIGYWRPETDEEIKAREELAAKNYEWEKRQRAIRDVVEFERLWVKFGGKPPGAV
jgi:hypothetical protein